MRSLYHLDVQVDVQRGRWPAARVSEHAAGDGEAAGLAGEKEVGGQLRRRQGGAQDSQDQPGTVCSNFDIDVTNIGRSNKLIPD